MKLDVSPTRMELMKLKKRLTISKRGHKLLKDKLDEFVRQLLLIIKEIEELRKFVDDELFKARAHMNIASSYAFPEALHSALSVSEDKIFITTELKQLLNVKIPQFKIEPQEHFHSYGFVHTSSTTDSAIAIFKDIMPDIIKISEKEKAIEIIADEIEKTRRRVNALEYILIPNVEETIKYIKMRLDENERDNQTQLMRVKEIVRNS